MTFVVNWKTPDEPVTPTRRSQTVGVYHATGPNAGQWVLDYNGNGQWDGASVDRVARLGGLPGDVPVVGDWSLLGPAIGVYHATGPNTGQWVLDDNGNGQWDGASVDRVAQLGGLPGDVPVVGDWSWSGTVKVGVYHATGPNAGQWVLDYNGNGQWDGPSVDRVAQLGGLPGDVPVVGDWSLLGPAIGVYHATGPNAGQWVLDYNVNGQWDGPSVDRVAQLGGLPGDVPVVGDWSGSRTVKVGVYHATGPNAGQWVLDYNGNGQWDGPSIDRVAQLGGLPGDIPVVGP